MLDNYHEYELYGESDSLEASIGHRSSLYIFAISTLFNCAYLIDRFINEF